MICAVGLAIAAAAGLWYMLDIRMVWESVGLLWRRLHRSPWRHAPIWVGVRGGGGEAVRSRSGMSGDEEFGAIRVRDGNGGGRRDATRARTLK